MIQINIALLCTCYLLAIVNVEAAQDGNYIYPSGIPHATILHLTYGLDTSAAAHTPAQTL